MGFPEDPKPFPHLFDGFCLFGLYLKTHLSSSYLSISLLPTAAGSDTLTALLFFSQTLVKMVLKLPSESIFLKLVWLMELGAHKRDPPIAR